MHHPSHKQVFSPCSLSLCIVQGNRKAGTLPWAWALSSRREYQVCHWLLQSLSSLFSDGSCLWRHYSYAGNPNSKALCLPLRWDISNKGFEFCAFKCWQQCDGKAKHLRLKLGIKLPAVDSGVLTSMSMMFSFEMWHSRNCSNQYVLAWVLMIQLQSVALPDINQQIKLSCRLDLASVSLFELSCFILIIYLCMSHG